METPSLLTNPAIQSGIIPFMVALVCGWLFKRMEWVWAGLAVLVGFYVSVYFVNGLDYTPLTSTRKLLLLGAGGIVVGYVFDLFPPPRKLLWPLLMAVLAAGALWMIWPALSHKEGAALLAYGVGALVYAASWPPLLDGLRERPLRATVAMLGAAGGTGIATLMGASALLGQLGLALFAALGAFLLLSVGKKVLPIGYMLWVPVSILLALLGVAGLVYAQLQWPTLAVLAAIPLAARIPLPKTPTLWTQALMLLVIIAPLAGVAVWLTLRVTGAPPL